MSLNNMLFGGCGAIAIVLSLVQVAPVQLKPWSWIMRAIGKALTGEVLDKLDEHDATAARYRIIRFDDEIRHKTKHTEEHFNQIVDDITMYEKYCKLHPNYENNKAVMAIENIKDTYKKCRSDNSFLI